jgi:DNA-binding transcriptional ArsR family regulator
MFCNSSYLADWKKIPSASDATVLAALGHPDKIRIVERLADGDAKQKELVADLEIKSGTISRWLADLSRAQIVSQDREGTHDPYRLVRKERTEELLDLAALLASELSTAGAERAESQRRVDAERLAQRQARRRR